MSAKTALIASIVLASIANSVLLTSNAPFIGGWGLCMQLFYSLLLDSLPVLNTRSIPFVALCGTERKTCLIIKVCLTEPYFRWTVSSKMPLVLLLTAAITIRINIDDNFRLDPSTAFHDFFLACECTWIHAIRKRP
jgi:hypothetical protein